MSAAVLTAAAQGASRSPTRQLGARLSGLAAGYLASTPLVQWHRQALQIEEANVVARAKARGLVLVRAKAVNANAYDIYDSTGQFLRRGSLSSMQHFAERYQGKLT